MKRSVIALFLGSALGMASAQQMQPWLTRSLDNSRSGWNDKETVLTQASVREKGVSLKTVIPVMGDARGMEAQPLILPGVNTAQGKRDVMVLPSMANVVRGVDAHDGSGIWQVTLGTPIQGSGAIDFHNINDKWGCLSTGVIDPDTARDYQVCWVSPDGSGNPQTGRYYMFVLNVADGTQVVPPVLIDGLDFNAKMRKARSSAVLIKPQGMKTVLQCTGSVMETSAGSSGYCFAFDTATNKVTAIMATTQGNGAGIWMAGAGLACDADQDCYAMTGNGGFDGVSQWGESFIKIRYTPPQAGHAALLKVLDHWTPWTDQARAGAVDAQPPDKLAGRSLMSEAVRPVGGGMAMPIANSRVEARLDKRGKPVLLVWPQLSPAARTDQDLGSGGLAYVAALNIVCGGGKDGLLYCLHADAMGGTTPAALHNPHANCAKLVGGAPVWATMDPGAGIDPCPQDPRNLNFLPFGDTAHIHAPPVVMFDPLLNAWTLFLWGENQQLHKWKLSADTQPQSLGESREYASPDVRGTPPGGMPGGFCAGSSNGRDPNTYLLVCAVPHGDANANRVQGHIVIYDPVHVGADGYLPKLWDSDDWGWSGAQEDAKYRFFNKFMPPVIDGGEIFLPNYAGGVLVIGQ
ncbi:MAG TPA: hypothetical protein VF730_09495 [Terracidiphilus sp.]